MNLKISIILLMLSTFQSLAGNETCPLNKDQKKILEEAVNRSQIEASWIVSNSSQGAIPHRAFSRNLIGSNHSHTGIFSLIEQCSEARTFDKYCENCEDSDCPTKRRCSQIICEGANMDSTRVWWEQAPFSYNGHQSNLSNYLVRYSKVPSTIIRYDGSTPNLLNIQWHSNDQATVKINGKTYRVRSSLDAQGKRSDVYPLFVHVKILYPELINLQTPVVIDFQINQQHIISGTIFIRTRTLAIIRSTGKENAAEINWLQNCE